MAESGPGRAARIAPQTSGDAVSPSSPICPPHHPFRPVRCASRLYGRDKMLSGARTRAGVVTDDPPLPPARKQSSRAVNSPHHSQRVRVSLVVDLAAAYFFFCSIQHPQVGTRRLHYCGSCTGTRPHGRTQKKAAGHCPVSLAVPSALLQRGCFCRTYAARPGEHIRLSGAPNGRCQSPSQPPTAAEATLQSMADPPGLLRPHSSQSPIVQPRSRMPSGMWGRDGRRTRQAVRGSAPTGCGRLCHVPLYCSCAHMAGD